MGVSSKNETTYHLTVLGSLLIYDTTAGGSLRAPDHGEC